MATARPVVEAAIDAKLWAPAKMTIPASFQAAACRGLDVQGVVETANALGAGGLNDMMVQIVSQIMLQQYPTPGER